MLLSILASVALTAEPAPDVSFLSDCTPIEACVDLLSEQNQPLKGRVDWLSLNGEAVAAQLKRRFGEDGRRVVLSLAADEDTTSHDREIAYTIIGFWGDWRQEHFPALRLVYEVGGEGSNIVSAIAATGSYDAGLFLLVEAARGQLGAEEALVELSPDVFASLASQVPLLFADPLKYPDEARVGVLHGRLHELVRLTLRYRSTLWVEAITEIAIDPATSDNERMAALASLQAIGAYADTSLPQLRRFSRDLRADDLRNQMLQTRVAMRDPVIAADYARSCVQLYSNQNADTDYFYVHQCWRNLLKFGGAGREAARELVPLMKSGDRETRATIIDLLGKLQDESVAPDILPFLQSDDWREVYFAVMSLAQLNYRPALKSIDKLQDEHWAWPVRLIASYSQDAILYGHPLTDKTGGRFPYIYTMLFVNHTSLLDQYEQCQTHKYRAANWDILNTENFSRVGLDRLEYADGTIVGTDDGEFGGELRFEPADGSESTILVREQTKRLVAIGDRVLGIHGIAHLGYHDGSISLLARNSDGAWQVERHISLLANPGAVLRLSENRIGIEGAGMLQIVDENALIVDVYPCAEEGSELSF
ncbi:HEAT repeat domain-containing protein [Parvularcula sp. LCG005]|uniref:HEAT repeat domain-containing protein n=1 Tax=Parvularcula sp. LCG005 TaxID=3078805 RepID=UPI002942A2A2|nr:HEAT repeat domain-containing protein [Parvularcula sp. LCG005]WOI52145.1 HEAT repeat domain-containing protein [Parvularcula sp. LCG005]